MSSPSRLALTAAFAFAVVLCGSVFYLFDSSSSSSTVVESSLTRGGSSRNLARSYCSCASCTTSVWESSISSGTCGSRIRTLQRSMSNLNACRQAADEFPSSCGVCHPDRCGSSSTTTTSTSSSNTPSTPTSSSTSSTSSLTVRGNNGAPTSDFPLGECEGDCDGDGECASGLICFQRSGTESVPGCSDSSNYKGIDFCVKPSSSTGGGGGGGGGDSSGGGTTQTSLSIKGNNNDPGSAFPLGKCQGDCDSDGDCAGDLVCLQRGKGDPVPGCSGTPQSNLDYCVEPSSSSGGGDDTSSSGGGNTSNNNLPTISKSSSLPLDECQGDCNSNADCRSGLFCYHRNGGFSVPGCNGGLDDSSDTDYCIDPYQMKSIPPQNVDNGRTSGSTFLLKLHWQPGYDWQQESVERNWCMRCSGDDASCSNGRRIYLTNCEIDLLATELELNYVNSDTFQIKVSTSDLCLTVPNDLEDPMEVRDCQSGDERQLYKAQNGQAEWGSDFEISPVWTKDGCIGNKHHPKYGETIHVWKCDTSRRWTTNAWNFY